MTWSGRVGVSRKPAKHKQDVVSSGVQSSEEKQRRWFMVCDSCALSVCIARAYLHTMQALFCTGFVFIDYGWRMDNWRQICGLVFGLQAGNRLKEHTSVRCNICVLRLSP